MVVKGQEFVCWKTDLGIFWQQVQAQTRHWWWLLTRAYWKEGGISKAQVTEEHMFQEDDRCSEAESRWKNKEKKLESRQFQWSQLWRSEKEKALGAERGLGFLNMGNRNVNQAYPAFDTVTHSHFSLSTKFMLKNNQIRARVGGAHH